MLYVVLVLIGVGLGVIFTTVASYHKCVGVIRVDQSDPSDRPYLFLELSKDVHTVCAMDYVRLRVKVKNYISHK